ncbi:MAG: 2-C-methyl-D-erythritol 4-phosphate cytidylyltransferase [Actinobacteria bacterium]|nr:2-C-methyl-D-erythritol 4-phosphate cytidylyltransferase [Actinomycetota bacterium]
MVDRKAGAVICAAGASTRMNSRMSKQLIPLRGKPVIAHTLSEFEKSARVSEVVLVVNRGVVDYYRQNVVERYNFKKVRRVVSGGINRQDSVYSGLLALSPYIEIVSIHDGARPLVTAELIDKTVELLDDKNGIVVAVPAQDTIKIVGEDGIVVETPKRSSLWAVQTPQVFPLKLIKEAIEHANEEGFVGTDDASLMERLGYKVHIVLGTKENMKITTPIDLTIAEVIMNER